jgi:hypothetical protein
MDLQKLRADLQTLLRRARAAAPASACMVVGPMDAVSDSHGKAQTFKQRPFLESVVGAEREIALAEGCAFFDTFTAMGGAGSLARFYKAGFMHEDLVHPRGRGLDLLGLDLTVDPEHASGRGGPRAYLHTAGVATADADGQVVSSLVSVFDDFGSGVFVPELGIVLNNRAAGFTDGDNAAAAGKRPVHTLAPAMVTSPAGVLGLATPGADGQVQTLLQVLAATALAGVPLHEAVGAPRWRSQDGYLLLEADHPAQDSLLARGHRVVPVTPGADVFGAVVAAGTHPLPHAVADWRRQCNSQGVA